MKLTLPFPLFSKVYIDDDPSIAATIIGFCWRGRGVEAEVSYICNGDLKLYWVDVLRLSEAK